MKCLCVKLMLFSSLRKTYMYLYNVFHFHHSPRTFQLGDVAHSRAQNKMTLLERLVAFVERTFVVDE